MTAAEAPLRFLSHCGLSQAPFLQTTATKHTCPYSKNAFAFKPLGGKVSARLAKFVSGGLRGIFLRGRDQPARADSCWEGSDTSFSSECVTEHTALGHASSTLRSCRVCLCVGGGGVDADPSYRGGDCTTLYSLQSRFSSRHYSFFRSRKSRFLALTDSRETAD